MPYLTLRVAGAVPRETLTALVRRLTELTAGVLGKKPEVTAVTVEHVSSTHWFIGGKPLESERRTFFLEVNVTEGTNTKDEKAAFVAAAFSAAAELLGSVDIASYVAVREVRADAYGYGGMTQEQRYVLGQRLPVQYREPVRLRAGGL